MEAIYTKRKQILRVEALDLSVLSVFWWYNKMENDVKGRYAPLGLDMLLRNTIWTLRVRKKPNLDLFHFTFFLFSFFFCQRKRERVKKFMPNGERIQI